MKVEIGKLTQQVMKELDDYGIAVGLQVDAITREVAEDTAKELRNISPKDTGAYAAAWTYGKGATKKKLNTKTVYAEKPAHALTHLLEKGHQKKNGGRTDGIPHISKAEEKAIEELEKELKARL